MDVDKVLRKPIEAGLIPGVVALAADDHGVIYEGAFGRRAVDKPEPMTLDSVFRIASMTKAITGTAAMQLVEKGQLGLEQPIGEVLPVIKDVKVLEGHRSQLSSRKLVSEHGKAAAGCFFFHLVLDDVPVLGQFAILKAHDIRHDPVHRQTDTAKPAVKQHVVAIGDHHPILVMEVTGEPFDHVEESLTSGGNGALC